MSQPENDWYFVSADGRQQGPQNRASLLAMYVDGGLSANTLVWSAGMQNWQPFGKVFKDSLPPSIPAATVPPPSPTQSNNSIEYTAQDESRTFMSSGLHPWRRYFAKLIDISLLGVPPFMLLLFSIGYFFPGQSAGLVKVLDNEIIASVLFIGAWIPIEAIFLSVFGNTPGRWLYGIYVRSSNGEKLSFGKAIERTSLVAVQGLGVGIPIIALFTQLFAHSRLKKTGTTLWDTSVGSIVWHMKWDPFRAVLCVIATVGVFFLIVVLNVIGSRT